MDTIRRIQTIRTYMEEHGIELCVFSSPENIQYLSDFHAITYSRPILFVIRPDTTDLILPALEEQHASLLSTGVEHLHVYYEQPEKADRGLSAFEVLKGLVPKKGTVGVEFGSMSIRSDAALHAWGLATVDVGAKLVEMRAVKDEREIEYIREACRLCKFAFAHSLPHAKEGVSELEFEQYGTVALFEHLTKEYPYQFSSPNCITPSGPERTIMPHVDSGTRRFQKGDMVIHVRKPAVNGYHGELERTFFIGKPGAREERAFLAMLEAQRTVIDAIRPGVTSAEMDKLGRDVLRRYGYEEYAIHRIGHGQGLGRHEEPYLIFNSPFVLKAGMVFTVEPGFYIPGLGGFRNSDTLLITEHGCENLTEFRRELPEMIF